jgi:hypothetical protein
MFERLVRNGLAGFRLYLEANVIDPYAALDNALTKGMQPTCENARG